MDKIFQSSKDTSTFLEVNSLSDRLDLKDSHIKDALKYGCKLVINTDAHFKERLSDIQLGIATARRGWAEKKDIINTYPLKDLYKFLDK
jgi:DNA polymerase (family 10)